ncbi:MAG: sodium:solute symporter family protein [Thiofilum sp.]|uniref:sodium:solute symporter family protein n=1 Tax=Thiofilum sp. TaxID=2212733 RepID=UPI0025D567B7|nr:sodium:solute symporter family protein [Thiofilum sp.]MBK8453126.1 cation acetate symporter [Thiofilum sp.]
MSDLQLWTYIVVGVSFGLYLAIAIWARAGTTSEFYVAGKGVHPIANGMATAADWMSAASFISMAGILAFSGYQGSAFIMGWTGGYVLLALLIVPYLRKLGQFTVPGFIGLRYDSNAARLVAVLCLLIVSLTYVIGQMKGVGVTFARFLDLSVQTGLLIGMVIIFIYAVLGGMKGITYTQIAQYVVLIFAYTIPAIFISLQLTGQLFPQIGLGSTLVSNPSLHLLDALDKLVTDLGFNAYTHSDVNKLNMFLLTMTLMLGTAGLPHIIVRFFTVPTVRETRSSAAWTLLFIAILYTTAPALGAMARLNITNAIQLKALDQADANLVYEYRPDWMYTWEQTGLVTFTDKNNDGRIQYYNDKGLSQSEARLKQLSGSGTEAQIAQAQANLTLAQQAHEQSPLAKYGWKGNELVLDNDMIVLANPEIAGMPNWLVALTAAGAIAAALSTAAGLLLTIAAAISHDVVKSILKPDLSEGAELTIGRIAMTVAIVIAGYMGLKPPGFAAEVVALAFGLAAASLFPALWLGIFSKRMNQYGAISGMLTGLIVTLTYIFWFKGWGFIPETAMAPNNAQYWLWGISPEAFGAVGACINLLVAIAVAAVTSPPPAKIDQLVSEMRIPKHTQRLI